MVPKNFRHIIWDWNGTLLDDKWLCIESINVLLDRRGIKQLDLDKYHEIFDFPVKNYYERAGFDFIKEPFEIPAMEFIELYRSRCLECSLNPGAIQVLDTLREMGVSHSLLSASEEMLLARMTEHFGISQYFRVITGLNNHYATGKVDLGRQHLQQIPFHPDEIIMVGDTCHDQEVAHHLGIKCILYTNGHFPEHRLRSCGTMMVSSLSDLCLSC